MSRIPTAVLAVFLCSLCSAALPPAAAAQEPLEDETRDRVLLTHRNRGTLAPGTRPKCFPPQVDDTVAASQYQCPWDPPNGRPRYPTARSLWGLFGSY